MLDLLPGSVSQLVQSKFPLYAIKGTEDATGKFIPGPMAFIIVASKTFII